jgi:hypothetical protein
MAAADSVPQTRIRRLKALLKYRLCVSGISTGRKKIQLPANVVEGEGCYSTLDAVLVLRLSRRCGRRERQLLSREPTTRLDDFKIAGEPTRIIRRLQD